MFLASKNHSDIVLPLLILSGFIIFVTPIICPTPVFWMDEAWDTAVAWSWINLGKFGNPTYPLDGLDEVFFLHPPLPIILESVLIKLFGITPWVVKFWPVTMGVLGVIFFYLIAKEIFKSKTVAIFGMIYLISLPLYLTMMFQFRPEIFVSCFTILTVYLVILAEKKQNIWLYFGAGVSSALSFLCHFYGGFLIGAVGLYLMIEWFKQKDRNTLKCLLFFGVGIVIVLVPYFIWILQNWEIFKVQYFGNLSNLTALDRFVSNIIREKQRYFSSLKAILIFLLIIFTGGSLLIFKDKFFAPPFFLCSLYFIIFLLGLALFMPNKTLIYITPILFITALVVSFFISKGVDIKNRFILFIIRMTGPVSLTIFIVYIITYGLFTEGFLNYQQLLHFNQLLDKNYESGVIVGDPTYFIFLPNGLKHNFISDGVLFKWAEGIEPNTLASLFNEKEVSILITSVYSDANWLKWCKENNNEICLDSILNKYGEMIGTVRRENGYIDYVYKLNISNL